MMRSLGERGVLDAVDAVLVARAPAAPLGGPAPTAAQRRAYREAQRDTVVDVVARYTSDAVVCVGPPFGHTRPQWILPYGGLVTVDGVEQRVWADYG
jgi:muramoyltetrapeptide carboxypeptidase LdcA involved in peptidoglycan recycling